MKLKLGSAAGLFAFAVFTALSIPSARAQSAQGPVTPKPGTPVQQKPPENTIRVRVAEVSLPVTVHDTQGDLVLDLKQKNFRVFDNGTEQKIESFDMGGEPLSVVLVFDTSSRVEPLLPAVRKSAIVFTQSVVGASGDAAILTYNDDVERLLPFSADQDRIEKSIANLKAGTGGERLYDAMSMAVSLLRDRPPARRRAMLVVGEAKDAGSEEKLGQVLREAQLANIVIYTVGLSTTAAELRAPAAQSGPVQVTPPGTFGGPPVPGSVQTPTTEQQEHGGYGDLLSVAELIVQDVSAAVRERPLEVATLATGGAYQPTFRDKSIEKAVDAIGGELNAQYTLSYHPSDARDQGYHQIKVTVDHPELKVRTRPGYFLEEAAK